MTFSIVKLSITKLLNLTLRISGIGSKFLVLTLMSKYFSIGIFGEYSLAISLITVLIFSLGLDFYNFSIRDILTTKNFDLIRDKVASTFFLYIIIYIVFALIANIFFYKISYVKNYVPLVIGLSISEHLSQEIYRLLIGFKRVLLANILLFFRTASWALIVVYFIYNKFHISPTLIFKLWLIADILTIIYVLFFALIKNINHLKGISISFIWLKKGFKVCYLFFLATISLKSIEYANRFIVNYFLGNELAGIFTFYSNISILITVYINTMVISFDLPELIEFSKTNKIKSLLQKFKKSLLLQTVISSIFLLFIIKPLLIWQDKIKFENYLPLIFFMIVAVGLMNYSLYYHFKLYIFHKDKALLKVMIISGVLSLVLTVIATYLFGLYGSAVAFVFSGIIMFYMRYSEANKIKYV